MQLRPPRIATSLYPTGIALFNYSTFKSKYFKTNQTLFCFNYFSRCLLCFPAKFRKQMSLAETVCLTFSWAPCDAHIVVLHVLNSSSGILCSPNHFYSQPSLIFLSFKQRLVSQSVQTLAVLVPLLKVFPFKEEVSMHVFTRCTQATESEDSILPGNSVMLQTGDRGEGV